MGVPGPCVQKLFLKETMQILVELGITHVRPIHKRGLLRPVDRQGK